MADMIEDKHTIFIVGLGPVTAKQLNASIESYLRSYSVRLNKPREFWGNWYTNLISSKGVAYVFFDKTPSYYIMAGLNIDGDVFYEEIPNPEYEEWEKNEEEFLNTPLNLSSSISWSDTSDTPPKTIKNSIDGPLIEFPPIKLDSAQVKISNNSDVRPKILRCGVSLPPPDLDKDTLFACNVSSDITEKDIKDIFKRFVTSTTFKEPRVSLVRQKTQIKIPTDDWRTPSQKHKKEVFENKVFIKFDSNTNDALFALKMAMKCKIRGSDVTFRHSKVTRFRDAKPQYTEQDAMRSMYFA